MGRGVAIYIADHLVARVNLINIGAEYKECVWLELKTGVNSNILLGCIYRSSSSPTENDCKLQGILTSAASRRKTDILIMGDFNLPDIDWMTNTTERSTCHSSQVFIDAVRDACLHQHVSQPTRFRHGQIPHVLDLILTSDEHMINSLEHHAGLGLSDHVVMSCNLSIKNTRVTDGKSRFNYNKGNYEEINKHKKKWTGQLNSKANQPKRHGIFSPNY